MISRLTPPSSASSKAQRRTYALCRMSTLALLVCAAAAPQLAWGVNVARFNRSPRAKVALEAARQYAKAGRVGKAANWAERAAWCPDATAATRASVAKLQAQLKWRLRDAGFGVVEVSVAPAGTSLSVDGQLFLPKRPLYRLFLPKGSHQLQVAKDQFHTYRSIITAKPGEVRPMRVKLEYAVRPRVRFLVKPVTAEIWRAQDFLGFSSKVEFELPPGKNLIEVRAPGYTSWVHTLDLRAGDKRTIKVFLDKAVSRGRSRPAASNVRRKLTPLELANRGERHRLGRRPIDRNGRRRAYRGSGAAPEPMKQKKPDWKSVTPKGGAGPAPDDSDAPPPEPMGDDGDDGGGDTGGDVGGDDGGDVGGDSGGADTGVSAGGSLSNAAKGWIYGGLGLALMAGGAGMAVYGVGEANYANSLSLGHEDYDQYYDFAANLTYAGYGAAGIGAASLVVGGIYLFSKGGLSRRGKGLFLLGAGAATGLLGGYLVFDALQTANAANKLPIRHHAYERDFDGAESNWRAGVIAGGVGGAVALVGVWLALTGGDSGDEEDEANASPSWWERTTIIPSVAPGRASVTLTW